MTEVEELVVAMRGEGLDETTEQIGQADEQMGEASGDMEDSADEMEGFANRWNGAMLAIMGGLAVAAGGLLTQVPVVSELMGGLESVINAVAFQMDSVLRPVLGPLTDGMFDLSDAIFNADGALGTLIGSLATGAIVAIAAFVAGASTLVAIAGGLITGYFLAAQRLGLLGEAMIALMTPLGTMIALFNMLIARLTGVNVIDALEAEFMGLVDAANGWGIDFVAEFAAGIQTGIGSHLEGALDGIESALSNAISFDMRENDRMAQRWGEDLISEFSVGLDRGARVNLSDDAVSGDGDGRVGRPTSPRGDVSVILDGRKVDKGTRPFRDRETSNRGRFS